MFPHIFFPGRSNGSNATVARHLRHRLRRAPHWLCRFFGHFGDRVGRKATLVASLLTMGISTVVIGLLPGYATIGIFAPLLLALARFGQGLGLGGEWGGAALLATENAHRANVHCTAPSRSWAHRLASSLPAALSCCFPGY